MNKHATLLLTILLLVVQLPCNAWQDRFYGQGELSCNLVTNITQDTYGFVWIGTEYGLNRFDGWKFVSYFHNDKDTTSLIADNINKLFTDKNGHLWVGTSRGLQYYSPCDDAFRTIHFPETIAPNVSDIIELHNGEKWVLTSGYGPYSIDQEHCRADSIEWLNGLFDTSYLNCIYEDSSHHIWVSFLGNHLARISPQTKKAEIFKMPYTPYPKVYNILEDEQGHLIIATHTDVLWKDKNRRDFKPIRFTNGTPVNARGMIRTANGTIYVNTNNDGILLLNTAKMCLEPTTISARQDSPNLAEAEIKAFLEDRNGNLWISYDRKGLLMLPNENVYFDFIDFASVSPNGYITAVYDSKEDGTWIGNSNGMLYRTDKQGRILQSVSMPKPVCSIFKDSNGTLWLGAQYGGLMQLDPRSGKYIYFEEFKDKIVGNIVEGPNQILYLALPGTGLVPYDLKTGKWQLITYTSKLSTDVLLGNDWIKSLLADDDGLIWIGHCVGISCYDPKRHACLDLEISRTLSPFTCYALIEDEQHNIWIGTNNGLYRYNKASKVLHHYGRNEGMPSNMVCGLAEDNNGNIWCSTFKGLCQVNRKDYRIVNYLSGNGLVDREYVQGVSFRNSQGEIFFGGANGVTKFNPDTIGTYYFLQRPVLSQLYINSMPVDAQVLAARPHLTDAPLMSTKQLNFTSNDNAITFECSTLEFHDCNNINFEYRLTELGKKWTQTALGENRITYNYLPHGNYTFEVRACKNDIFSPILSIGLYIAPPWYLSTWARLFYLLAFCGTIAQAYHVWLKRQRRKRNEEINEAKLRFFINIAHEIRSPITLIVSPLTELIKKGFDNDTLKALKTMQRNANRIMHLINQLLDIRKIDKGQMKIGYSETNLTDFMNDILAMFDYQAAKRNIDLTFSYSDDNIMAWIDRNNFDKAVMNLLMNAFKYTEDGGKIAVSLTSGKANTRPPLHEYIELSITDTGIGLNADELEKIFERFYQSDSSTTIGFGIGLNLTQMLVALHHGTLTATNRTDKQGSCFTIRIPAGRKHLANEQIQIEAVDKPHIVPEIASDWELQEANIKSMRTKTHHRVLIADDDIELCRYLQAELESVYRVQVCHNGAQALQMVLQQRFDLIISDIVMPGLDGFELLKKVKSNANTSHIPIVLLTSQTEAECRTKGWEMGADAFLPKPFGIEELAALCNNLIDIRSHLKGKFGSAHNVENCIKPIELKSNDELLIERLATVVNNNMDNPRLTVETLAEEAGISRVQLHRRLRELCGVSTSEFIRNIRLRQAAVLLKERKINISQIAYAVGFNTPSLFSVAFKKLYGCSPTEYQEMEESGS